MECQPNPECRYYDQGCRTDTHHFYYPKKLYRDSVGRIYRELPENKEELCRREHDELHATENPPVKPGREDMLRAIGHHIIGGEYGLQEMDR